MRWAWQGGVRLAARGFLLGVWLCRALLEVVRSPGRGVAWGRSAAGVASPQPRTARPIRASRFGATFRNGRAPIGCRGLAGRGHGGALAGLVAPCVAPWRGHGRQHAGSGRSGHVTTVRYAPLSPHPRRHWPPRRSAARDRDLARRRAPRDSRPAPPRPPRRLSTIGQGGWRAAGRGGRRAVCVDQLRRCALPGSTRPAPPRLRVGVAMA